MGRYSLNYFHVAVAPDISKIVFGEGYADQRAVNFHTSVTMTTADAATLAGRAMTGSDTIYVARVHRSRTT